ncbi:MAG: hypothetical protein WD402_10195 [Chloroflexota bacterium]
MTAALSAVATVAAVVFNAIGADHLVVFATSAVALAGLATLIGQATEQLGHRFGPRTTGILQSALGNLPELFISIFALQAGLVVVVQTALIGSILANALLVLGWPSSWADSSTAPSSSTDPRFGPWPPCSCSRSRRWRSRPWPLHPAPLMPGTRSTSA